MTFEFKLDDFRFLETIFYSALAHFDETKAAPVQSAIDELQTYRQHPSGANFSFSDPDTLQNVLVHAAGNKSTFLGTEDKTKARLLIRNIHNPHYDLWRVPDEIKAKHGFYPSLPHPSPDEFVDLYEHFLFALDTAETSIGNFHSIDLTDNERITDFERGLYFFVGTLQAGAVCGVDHLFELALTLVNKYRILLPLELKPYRQNPAYQCLEARINHYFDAIKEGLRVLLMNTLADKLSPQIRSLICEGIAQYLLDLNPQWATMFDESQPEMDDDQIVEAFDYLLSTEPEMTLQMVTQQFYSRGDFGGLTFITPFAPPMMGSQFLMQ